MANEAWNEKEWFATMQKLLDGTLRQADLARWKMGYKTGVRKEQARILSRLEKTGLIWWDKEEQAWLNMVTGKPIYGLDWNEGKTFAEYNDA